MAKKQDTFTLDPQLVDIGLWQLAELDNTIRDMIGNVAELKKKAVEAVEPDIFVEVPAEVKTVISEFAGFLAAGNEKFASQSVDMLAMAVSLLSDSRKQAIDEAVTAWLKSNTKDTGAGLEALQAQRAEKAEAVKAMGTILKQVGLISSEPDIPSAPKSKASNGGGGGTRGVKVSGAQYYRVIDGERVDQPESQNSASSLAYYFSQRLVGGDHRLSAEEFKTWAQKEHGVDIKSSRDWEITANGITVGMRVVGAETPASTETPETPEAKEEEAKA